MKNRLLRGAPLGGVIMGLVLTSGCAALIPQKMQDRFIQKTARASVENIRTGLLDDGFIHVITLGTGSPQPGAGRLPQSTAVLTGGRFIVIDAGEGAGRQIADLNLPLHRVTDVLITHFHSDHIGGLGQLLNQSWNSGRTEPVTVWGPEGIQPIMESLEMLYAADISYRTANIVEHNDPALALGDVRAFELVEGENEWVIEETEDLKIVAFRVDHGHVFPAVGYRIETGGRSVVISGDTRATPLMVDAARDADLLIHEAVNTTMMNAAAIGLEEGNRPVEAARARGVVDYHADTLALADMAQEAGVRHLVLSHLIPVPPNHMAEQMFMKGMGSRFSGKITVARDGMEFTIKP